MEYEVQQKATIWYKITVEANSPIEAIEKVREDEMTDAERDTLELIHDSDDFLDEFWTEETGLYDGMTGTYENQGEA